MLAVANFVLVFVLFGFAALEPIIEAVVPLFNKLPFGADVNNLLLMVVYLCALAVILLPITWVVLVAAMFGVITLDDGSSVVLVSIPNSIIWGFGVAFFYRLIRTGSIADSRSATLQWSIRTDRDSTTSCPHCGQPMPTNTGFENQPLQTEANA